MGAVDRVLVRMGGVLLGVMLVLALLQVVTRYGLMLSAPWTEELARLALVWAVFGGAVVGVARQLHTRVEVVFDRLPRVPRGAVAALIELIVAVLGGIMVVSGWDYTKLAWLDRSTSLGFPRGWFFLPVPLSGFLILGISIVRLARLVVPGRRPAEPSA